MDPVYEKLQRCYESYKSQIDSKPQVAVVLGSGLGDYADTIQVQATLPYSRIEGFPVSTAPGHKGQFVFGYIGQVPVVLMQGRVHYYEGYPMQDVVLPTRLMGLMGVKALLLTNAAGSINLDYKPGDFMLISDHITNFVPSPLIGPNLDKLGERFPDMSCVYDSALRQCVRDAAQNAGIPLQEGVYVQLSGPNFETPQEIRMCRTLGGDAAGMSTACEAMAARHMGVKVCGITCVTNYGSGISQQPLSGDDVVETGKLAAPKFTRLVTDSVQAFASVL